MSWASCWWPTRQTRTQIPTSSSSFIYLYTTIQHKKEKPVNCVQHRSLNAAHVFKCKSLAGRSFWRGTTPFIYVCIYIEKLIESMRSNTNKQATWWKNCRHTHTSIAALLRISYIVLCWRNIYFYLESLMCLYTNKYAQGKTRGARLFSFIYNQLLFDMSRPAFYWFKLVFCIYVYRKHTGNIICILCRYGCL